MRHIDLPGEITCASLTCREPATALAASVPLCDDCQTVLYHELRLPRARYIPPEDGRDWYVYYVTWPHTPDMVKIGATANLASRMTAYKRDGRLPVLLATEPGTDGLETERHTQFAELCTARRSETFRNRAPLTDHIRELRTQGPAWPDIAGRRPWWLNTDLDAEPPADPKNATRCGQPTRSEPYQPCAIPAGFGTTHLGTGPCYRHGGQRNTSDGVAACSP